MTQTQKIIKYCAIALAVVLIVSIVSGIVGVIGYFAGFGEVKLLSEPQAHALEGEIAALRIEISGSTLHVKSGDALSLESNISDLSVKQSKQTLTVREPRRIFGNSAGGVVTLTLPQGASFSDVEITVGAGVLTLESMTARELSLELGAGRAEITGLTVTDECSLESGTGSVIFKDCNLNDAEFDLGVGKLEFSGILNGRSEFNCGVGNVDVRLTGVKDDYSLIASRGIGSITVDGASVADRQTVGTGGRRIEINGGVGTVNVTFAG
ncbi:MAG: DUF4097 family beta strand repeat protein [Clostridia bacterium]|nr:DUF4097 family beta strand repeat protein [Clostridia bacterium]